ncbi:ferritin-like protein [Kutzneria viridogrisea]|uniref:Iminophenyl-pyruvate dimer synthase domain-containing protein n=2 Tax=Kutzneria TaxID=43356 RepID=W5W8Z9_9PSEU|nr:ferritin-like protein [Kutzneria albida]AHH97036.1 hypothetical protein KALB_3672 [Kutzneria albida DSM 43870]MBA8931997.1 rubrerythrin [Kutzneria viridogrisea]
MNPVADTAQNVILPSSVFDAGTTLEKLLQTALQVEFSAIPPYLTAMYSITDKTSRAYQLIRSVAMEEMLHLNLACNLLNAIGGKPELVISGKFPPRYPAHLSDEASGGGVYLQLMPASRQLIREVFMRIEQPAQPDAPAQPAQFSTIGQLYKAIKDRLADYQGGYDTSRQTTSWNFGNNGGTVIEVRDKKSAMQAINEIVEQGEGADMARELNPDEYQIRQPWGQYEYYGPRADGTYGPVLGTPLEMSHYFKFKAIADGTTPLPETYPMAPNPSVDKFENQLAVELGNLFNASYSIMVDELQKALHGDTEVFFTHAVPLMRTAMPVLATQLMQTPVAAKGYTSVDPAAGPPFRYVAGVTVQEITRAVDRLAEAVTEGRHPSAPSTLVAALYKVLRSLS